VKRLATAIRAPGDAGLTAWGQPWSTSCSWGSYPTAPVETVLPRWLVGRWRVKSKVDGVSFPMGRNLISESLPGVRMVSILPLPNVGSAPMFELEFMPNSDGGAVANRLANSVATLEAFWPSARVIDAEAPRPGQVLLRYESPTRSRSKVMQSVLTQLCASDGGASQSGAFVWSEVVQQDNVEQGTRGQYQVLLEFTPESTDRILARQRVAAYLQPTDGGFFDALGKPVALYDYSFVLTRLREDVA